MDSMWDEAVENLKGPLFAALAKAQKNILSSVKDQKNPFFNSDYSDLSDVWDVCRTPLADNGLCVIQLPAVQLDEMGTVVGVIVETILGHEKGGSISSKLYMPAFPPSRKGQPDQVVAGKPNAQSVGSAITYARRYALAAIVGVAPKGQDDDGNLSTGLPLPEKTHYTAPQRVETKPEVVQTASVPSASNDTLISEAQAKRFHAIANHHGVHEDIVKSWLLSVHGYASSKEIPRSKYNEIIAQVEAGLESEGS